MACAISSLPVPDSTRIITVVSVRTQVSVLLQPLLALGAHQAVDLYCLGEQPDNHGKIGNTAFVIAIGSKRKINTGTARGIAIHHDGHADETDVGVRPSLPLRGAMQEHRFQADAMDNDVPASFDSPSPRRY